MAPEYLAHGQLTEKACVYNFGVLSLEIIMGKQNNQIFRQHSISCKLQTLPCLCLLEPPLVSYRFVSLSLTKQTWKHFQLGTPEEIYDPNLMLHNRDCGGNTRNKVARVVQIELLCTQKIPSLRP
ncbi:hypothetical protein V6N11_050149 [Hibiscus sabdariffa]|uniref:Serine-threonine/tyrosine-protein kinase catalytic domain-containing protein n=1 Tax=Hibiscus sabdariffa TaxID=183260 RepID=A0ABR2T917_9ROSI